jgi:hypothetical protein
MAYVELKKVRYKPDSIVTTIDSAGYFLQWVYRTVDTKKDYYILPVATFEDDTTAFIRDEVSRAAFKTFVNDSRSLYKKHNINVPEINTAPSDSLITYQVHLSTDTLNMDSVQGFISNIIDPFFGVPVVSKVDHQNLMAIGPFNDHVRAKDVCLQLAQKGWAVQVKKYIDGVMIE